MKSFSEACGNTRCPHRGKDCASPVGYEGYYWTDGKFTAVKKCNVRKRWEKERDLDIDCEVSGLTTEHTWDSYKGDKSLGNIAKMKRYVEEHDRFGGKSLYVYGMNSTQKTSMCKVMGKELVRNGYKVRFLLMQELVDILCGCDDFDMDKSSASEKRKAELLDVDYLILDECFDKSKVTVYKSGYQLPYLDTFLRKRLESYHKPIVFISNVEPSRIEDSGYGASIHALVNRNTVGALLEFKDNFYEASNESAFADIFA